MRLALALLAGGAVAGSAGCSDVSCGPNTIQQDNVCVGQSTTPGADCGPGTVYNAVSGRCENSLFADGGGLCGPNTTLLTNDAGIRVCVGTGGGGGDCSQPLPCPTPSAGNLTLCGRLYNIEDTSPFDDGNPNDGEPWKTIELRVYDPIAFVNDPSTPPLTTKTPDSCGRFVIPDVPRPGDGFIAVASDDLNDGSNTDAYVQTGIASPATAGQVLDGMRAWVFKRSVDQSWSTAAGLTGGMTFGKMGVYIPIFLSGSAAGIFPAGPTAGVTIASVSNVGIRTPMASNDYYFDDSDPMQRKTVGARASTGPNGSGLYINTGLDTFSGVGGSPNGTCWAKDLAAAPMPGAYVQERTASADFCP